MFVHSWSPMMVWMSWHDFIVKFVVCFISRMRIFEHESIFMLVSCFIFIWGVVMIQFISVIVSNCCWMFISFSTMCARNR